MLNLRKIAVVMSSLALAVTMTACSDGGEEGSNGSEAGVDEFTIVVPSDPGGGWDQTARAMQKAFADSDLASQVEVTNVPGGSGTVGLAQVAAKKGQSDVMLMSGLAMVSAVATTGSDTKMSDLTPIARLMGEYEAIVVPVDSKYNTLKQLVDDIKADPQSVPIAGGAAGSADQLFLGLLAEEVGIDPTDLNYVPFSGGGEALTSILGGKVSAGVSGTGEFSEQVKAGKIRVLAVSSDKKVSSLPDAPTITEAGYKTVFSNWRGVVVPADMDEGDKTAYIDLVKKMHDSDSWQDTLKTQAWDDQYLSGDEFATWLSGEEERAAKVLATLGLAAK